jgi:hypothetical protein
MSACSADISAKMDPMGLVAGVGVDGSRGTKLLSMFSNLIGEALLRTVAKMSVALRSELTFGES